VDLLVVEDERKVLSLFCGIRFTRHLKRNVVLIHPAAHRRCLSWRGLRHATPWSALHRLLLRVLVAAGTRGASAPSAEQDHFFGHDVGGPDLLAVFIVVAARMQAPFDVTWVPFNKYGATFSPRQNTTLDQLVSSFQSPVCLSFQRMLVATENFTTAICEAVYAVSASLPRLPIRITLLTLRLAMKHLTNKEYNFHSEPCLDRSNPRLRSQASPLIRPTTTRRVIGVQK